MHNSKIKRISLAVCFALLPMAANAAGLGKLTVISGLGEPLNAEIELHSTTKDELASLSARIAPSEVFAEQGIERASALSGVHVDLGQKPDGTPVLRISSSQPVNDPFLDMLIQVEWSSGRLLREYTALLDPPGFGDKSGTTASVAAAKAEAPALPATSTSTEKAPVKTRARKDATAPVKPASETAPGEKAVDYTVHKGDTLRAIANQAQVEGVSLEQMLVGLYQANKDAFIDGNMNRLKVGQIIHVPDQEKLQAVSQPEAVKEIRVQTADWNAYRNKLAGMVGKTAPAKEEVSKQVATGKITAPAEDKSATPVQGPRDVVKLSKSESGSAAKAGDVAGRLSALQEEVTAREKAIKESNERIATLEKQLQDMQKLLDIKSKSLAEVQKNAAKAPEPVKPAVAVQPPKAEAAPPAPAAQTAPEQVHAAAEQKQEPSKPVVPPEVHNKPKKIVRPAPPPPEPSLLDTLLDNPLLLAGGGGGLLALIGGAWFYLRNKRKKGLDSFEQGILTTGGLKPNTVFGDTAGGTVDTGNTSFLTDFGQGTASGMIDTNDVDPIAEAEVYMAYGRDVQAEEILKDAIVKEPKRHELHLKLLEIFANRKDTGAFETLAGELYAALGATDATWAKVAEMGRKLEPDNPLYGEAGSPPKAAEPAPVDFDATMIQMSPTAASDELDLGLGLNSTEASLDFSLDERLPEARAADVEAPVESNALDFDVGGLELPSETLPDAALASAVPEASAEQETAGLDFQFDLPEPAAADNTQLDAGDLGIESLPELPEVAAGDTAADNEGLSLDLPDLDSAEPFAEATMLDETPADEAEPAPDLSLPDLELPVLGEAAVEALPEADAGQQLAELSLDLPALDAAGPAEEVATAEASLPEMDFALSEPEVPVALPVDAETVSLDLPGENAQAEAPVLDIDLAEALDIPSVPDEVVSLDQEAVLELPAEDVAAASAQAPVAVEEAVETAGDLDFNFDIDLGETEQQSDAQAAGAASGLPDLDLSGISLDVAGDVQVASAAEEEITLSSSDSPDVDTKLDLVTAYIDMGDQEGARELLQEVLQEGGPAQREKAQKLLDGLD